MNSLKQWLLYKIQPNYYQLYNEIYISKSLDKHPFLKKKILWKHELSYNEGHFLESFQTFTTKQNF